MGRERSGAAEKDIGLNTDGEHLLHGVLVGLVFSSCAAAIQGTRVT